MSIKLDWEVTDAPDDSGKPNRSSSTAWASSGGPPTSAPPRLQPAAALSPAPASTLPLSLHRPQAHRRWPWPLLVLVALAGIALTATWNLSRQGWQRIQGDIEALVRYEEEASYAGAVNLALFVQDPDNRDWLAVRRRQLETAQPAPAPLPRLTLLNHAFAVDAVIAIDGDFVQAQVRREFATPDGQSLPFVLPQFYRRRGLDDWQRTAPPGQFWGQWVDWRGEYVQVRHSERDAALVKAIAPRLEAWLAAACALWQNRCAGGLPAKLYLSGYVGSLEYDPLSNVEVRVEFGAGNGALAADYFLSVPSPQIAGQPTTAAGEDYWAEYLAVRLIASLAQRATDNAADYAALTARAIAALGLGRADPGYAALPLPQVEGVPSDAGQLALTPAPTATRTSAAPTQAGPRVVYYTVQAGDTLSGIASAYGISLENIIRANGITNPDVLIAGTVLSIPLS